MPDVRLIDANALLDFISDERKEASDNKNHEKMRGNEYEMHFWSGALAQARWIRQHVKEAPTIDAVPVVRCRECVYYKPKYALTPGENRMRCNHPCLDYDEECFDQWLDVEPEDYCKYGERKMDGGAENG